MPGNNHYSISYLESLIEDDIPILPRNIKNTIKRAIETRLTVDPIGFGRPLQYSLRGHRRLRVSDYRIVYRIDGKKKEVIIIAIKHRRDVYN